MQVYLVSSRSICASSLCSSWQHSKMAGVVPPLALGGMAPGPAEPDAILGIVPVLLGGLREGAAEEEQIESLLELAQLVDTSFGDRAVRLSTMLSADGGGIALLSALASHPREWLHQTSMLVLGNLASDSSEVEVRAAHLDERCTHARGPALLHAHTHAPRSVRSTRTRRHAPRHAPQHTYTTPPLAALSGPNPSPPLSTPSADRSQT